MAESIKPTVATVDFTLDQEVAVQSSMHSLSWYNEFMRLDTESTNHIQAFSSSQDLNSIVNMHLQLTLASKRQDLPLDGCVMASDWPLFLDMDEEVVEALT